MLMRKYKIFACDNGAMCWISKADSASAFYIMR